MSSSFYETIFKKLPAVLILCLVFSNLPAQVQASNNTHKQQNITPSSKKQIISYKLIVANNHTYGYNIFLNDTLFVHQPVIPCIAGNKGFKTKADAKKIAVLVIKKIRKGLIPPTVTIPEMEKLKIDLR